MAHRRRLFPEWVLPLTQLLLEVLCAWAAFLIACRLWLGPLAEWRPTFSGGVRDWTRSAPYLALLPFIPVIRLAANWHSGLHEWRGPLLMLEDLGKVLRAAFLGSVGLICLAFLYRRGFEDSGHSFSRAVFLIDFALSAAMLYTVRMCMQRWQRWIRAQGGNLTPCLLISTGRQAPYIRRQLSDIPTWGHHIVAELSIPPGDTARAREVLASLPELIHRHGAREVIVSDPTITYNELVGVILSCDPGLDYSVRVVPDLQHYVPSKVALGRVGMIPTLSICDEPIRGMNLVLKRALDVAVAGFALLITSPLFVATAIAIKLESPGPVLFRQERVGRDGRRFWFYKFRSMHVDNDDRAHREYVSRLISGQNTPAVEDPAPVGSPKRRGRRRRAVYKIIDDPRITRVGRFIRQHSIDELPQLINVLLGDMSLVGPRPPIAYEVQEYTDWHRKRLSIRPGITGLWQTMGRSKRTYNQMVKLDIFYIEHWSLWLDLRILFKTLKVVFGRSDAY